MNSNHSSPWPHVIFKPHSTHLPIDSLITFCTISISLPISLIPFPTVSVQHECVYVFEPVYVFLPRKEHLHNIAFNSCRASQINFLRHIPSGCSPGPGKILNFRMENVHLIEVYWVGRRYLVYDGWLEMWIYMCVSGCLEHFLFRTSFKMSVFLTHLPTLWQKHFQLSLDLLLQHFVSLRSKIKFLRRILSS